MIRDFRVAQAPRLFELLGENFPIEERIYGMRPEAWVRIVRRIYRWDLRFVIGFARVVRRPVFRFFTVEVDGRLAATTILSFTERAGYISMVMVDAPYRGRGFARRLLERCHATARSAGKAYVALDVFSENAPAIALYRSMGYVGLRDAGLYSTDLSAPPATPEPPRRSDIRPLQREDQRPLAEIAARTVPAATAEVLPPRRKSVASSGIVDQILSGESSNWVLTRAGQPVAWTSVSVSDAMEAATLAQPIVDESADPGAAVDLVRTAVAWARQRGAVRVVTQVPLENPRAIAALEGAGLRMAQRMHTLYRSVR